MFNMFIEGAWTKIEHKLFLYGVNAKGWGNWNGNTKTFCI